jgi:GNAT superfamily N-acetyltransferase
LSEPFRVALEPKDETVDRAIHAGLRAFNRASVNWPERQHFNVVLRDGEGIVRGGILASVNFDVLVLEDVFVEESCRHGGYGGQLMALAEENGRRLGARLAVVSTFSWRARPSYEKLGYAMYAQLPYDDGAYTLYSLKKSLCG